MIKTSLTTLLHGAISPHCQTKQSIQRSMDMRQEEFFLEHIAISVNKFSGHPKASGIYRAEKKKVFNALLAAGVKRRIAPFTNPVTLSYFPLVTVNPRTGRVLKGYDSINFALTYKILEDHLVKFGLLKDDRAAYVRASFCHAPAITDKNPGIRVVIEECADLPNQSSLL